MSTTARRNALAPAPPPAAGRQGNYAGAASRLLAFGVDVLAIWGLYVLGTELVNLFAQLVVGRSFDISRHQVAGAAVLLAWSFLYFAYQWALSGRTIGMAMFGIQVVRADGSTAGTRTAVLRTLALPLSAIPFFLGFVGLLTNRQRQGWHDRIARTAVVYSWDARAARLRWLARKSPPKGATPVGAPPAGPGAG